MNKSSNFRTFNIPGPKVFLSNFFSLMIATNPYHGFPQGESPGIFQLVHSIARTASPLLFFIYKTWCRPIQNHEKLKHETSKGLLLFFFEILVNSMIT